jgi:hypothetical protein
MLLHRTTQCFEGLILGSRKQTGVIENGSIKNLFWTFIVARKSAPQVQISSSGDEKPDHTYAEIPVLRRSVEDRAVPSLFVCRHDRRLVHIGTTVQQELRLLPAQTRQPHAAGSHL